MRAVTVTRTYLRLAAPDKLRGAISTDPSVTVRKLDPCPVPRFRLLYEIVGAEWHWRDRNAWSDDQLAAHLDAENVAVWEIARADEPAGYFELAKHADGTVEIVYFGLARSHFGGGLGKHLLTRAAEEAWKMGASSVWLHTCTLDSPAALPNYLARGFEPFRQEQYEAMLP